MTAILSFFAIFILIIIAFALFSVISIVTSVFRPFKKIFSSKNPQQTTERQTQSSRRHKKIIDKNVGEYVDFEEV